MGENNNFFLDAESILQTASRARSENTDLAIVITPDGGIHMRDAAGWSLPSLGTHYGARAVYRVSQTSRGVRVEGRSGSQTCLLEKETPAKIALRLLAPKTAGCRLSG